MDAELLSWIFLAGGILLMIAELLLPGGVAFFLGLSGVLVAALRFIGVLSDPVTSVTVWLLSSLGLVAAIRPLFMKYFGGASSFKTTDEDFEAMDEVVEVLEPVNEMDNSGRIRYQGASWQAMSLQGTIPKGAKAVIKYRDNVTWVVEALEGAELPDMDLPESEDKLPGDENTDHPNTAKFKSGKERN